MQTTALVVEILVIGVATWGAILLALYRFCFRDSLLAGTVTTNDMNVAAISALFIAFAYILGSTTNALSNWIFNALDDRLRRSALAPYLERLPKPDDAKESYHLARSWLYHASEQNTTHLDYLYSQVRVLRSSALIFAILTLVTLPLWRMDWPLYQEFSLELATFVFCALLTLLCYLAWWKQSRGFYRTIAQAYIAVTSHEAPSKS